MYLIPIRMNYPKTRRKRRPTVLGNNKSVHHLSCDFFDFLCNVLWLDKSKLVCECLSLFAVVVFASPNKSVKRRRGSSDGSFINTNETLGDKEKHILQRTSLTNCFPETLLTLYFADSDHSVSFLCLSWEHTTVTLFSTQCPASSTKSEDRTESRVFLTVDSCWPFLLFQGLFPGHPWSSSLILERHPWHSPSQSQEASRTGHLILDKTFSSSVALFCFLESRGACPSVTVLL